MADGGSGLHRHRGLGQAWTLVAAAQALWTAAAMRLQLHDALRIYEACAATSPTRARIAESAELAPS